MNSISEKYLNFPGLCSLLVARYSSYQGRYCSSVHNIVQIRPGWYLLWDTIYNQFTCAGSGLSSERARDERWPRRHTCNFQFRQWNSISTGQGDTISFWILFLILAIYIEAKNNALWLSPIEDIACSWRTNLYREGTHEPMFVLSPHHPQSHGTKIQTQVRKSGKFSWWNIFCISRCHYWIFFPQFWTGFTSSFQNITFSRKEEMSS